jgi:peptide deformylase
MDKKPLQIVCYPHPALRRKSKPIKRVDAELQRIIRDMFTLMYAANGIGLAANQVDLPLRLFVVNLAATPDEGEELVFLNPVLSQPKGNEEYEEGCLSLPQLYAPVRRPKQITVQAYNLRGEEVRASLDGMLSRVVQHEYDHLDGVLFTDRVTSTVMVDVKPVLDSFELEFARRRQQGEIPPDDQIAEQLQRWEEKYC